MDKRYLKKCYEETMKPNNEMELTIYTIDLEDDSITEILLH